MGADRTARLGGALLLALALALALGCGAPEPSARHVVWIVLDAAGARHVGSYGAAHPTTPRLDAFAEDAIQFTRAYAQSAWTPSSTASFLTGLYPPPRMQARGPGRLARGQSIVPQLARAGVRTAGFSENPFVTEEFGFDVGFDHFYEAFPHEVIQRKGTRYDRVDTDATVDAALEWLEDAAPGRFFLYLHLFPPHAPYDPPPPFEGRFAPSYDGPLDEQPSTLTRLNRSGAEVDPAFVRWLRLRYRENLAYADAQAGRVLDALRREGLADHTLVIVSADHGEAFGEHGLFLHGKTVYEEVLHVPLLVRFPTGAGELPSRWKGVVELRQIAPTVCRVLDVPCAPDGATDLWQVLRQGEPDAGVALAFSLDVAGRPLGAVIGPRFKLAFDGATARPRGLLDLRRDPDETHLVGDDHPEAVRRLHRALSARTGSWLEIRRTAVRDATRRRLRALGYVGPESGTASDAR